MFISKKTKKSIRQYMRQRNDNNPALWVKANGERLSYWGLVDLLNLRSKAAKVNRPSLHDFQRAFALNMLRNGVDIREITESILRYFLSKNSQKQWRMIDT